MLRKRFENTNPGALFGSLCRGFCAVILGAAAVSIPYRTARRMSAGACGASAIGRGRRGKAIPAGTGGGAFRARAVSHIIES